MVELNLDCTVWRDNLPNISTLSDVCDHRPQRSGRVDSHTRPLARVIAYKKGKRSSVIVVTHSTHD